MNISKRYSMEPLFLKLAEILAGQSQLAQQQIAAARVQNQALGQVDLPSLQEAVEQLTGLAGQMAGLNEQREQVQTKLEQELGLKPGASLSALLPRAPMALQPQLKELQNQLLQHLAQLRQLNEANELLTRQALHFNQTTLQIFTSGGGETYRHSGAIKKGDRSTGVLNKTV